MLIISGALASRNIEFSDKPLEFTIQTLLLFGYILAISFVITACIFYLLDNIQKEQNRNRAKSNKYQIVTGRDLIDTWGPSVLGLTYSTSIVIGIVYYNPGVVQHLGTIGLIILIASEFIDNLIFRFDVTEVLELKKEARGKVYARIISQPFSQRIFFLSRDWAKEIAYLMNQEWEIIEVASANEECYAMFRRTKTRINYLRETKRRRNEKNINSFIGEQKILRELLQQSKS